MLTVTPRTTPCKIEFVQDVEGSKTSLRLKWKYEKLALQLNSSFAFAVILRHCFEGDCYDMYKGLLNTLFQP